MKGARRWTSFRAAAVLAALLAGACLQDHPIVETNGVYDPKVTLKDVPVSAYDTVLILLRDPRDSSKVDTLWYGPLVSTGDLPMRTVEDRNLMVLEIRGVTRAGGTCFNARFEDGKRLVIVDSCATGDLPGWLDIPVDTLRMRSIGTVLSVPLAPAHWSREDLTWIVRDTLIATIAGNGLLHSRSPGTTWVVVRAASGLADSARLLVSATGGTTSISAGADTLVPLNTTLFHPVRVISAAAPLSWFWWDLDGNGLWDDSSRTTAKPEETILTPGHLYDKVGTYAVRFKVQDSGGNVAATTRIVTVPGQPIHTVILRPLDTLISIWDTVRFVGEASGQGKLLKFSFSIPSYENGGASGPIGNGSAPFRLEHALAFPLPGTYQPTFSVMNDQGTWISASTRLSVILDPPWAEAGRDTTVAPGGMVRLQGAASDSIGRILGTEWNLFNGGFRPGGLDTVVQAPSVLGNHLCILRVTDDDSLVRVDSMVVKVEEAPAARRLGSLKVSPGALIPAFHPDSVIYFVSAPATQDTIQLTAVLETAGSTLKVNGASYARPITSPLVAGMNAFNLEVTSPSGTGKRIYQVRVDRKP